MKPIWMALAVAGVVLAADLETGIRQLEQKQFAQAESTLREVVAAEPDNADANYYLGKALIGEKKYGEAEEFLKKAAETKPEARVALGEAYMMQEKLDQAMNELNEAEESQSSNADLYLFRGMIYLKRENAAEAARELDKALAIDPKKGYAHYYMGLAQSRLKRNDLVLKHFEMFLQLEPRAPEAARVRSLLRSL
jgi:Tfp pilus assembly protein PilF